MSEPSKPTISKAPIIHLSTLETYNEWAATYDTDGNMLQSLDTHQLLELLPRFLSLLTPSGASPSDPIPAGRTRIIELGCGTGRATRHLLTHPWPTTASVDIAALDFSQSMLDMASRTLPDLASDRGISLTLARSDCFPVDDDTATSHLPNPLPTPAPFDAALSTLVLEHVPLRAFFATLSAVLAPGGVALVTSMHPEMGAVSGAGFVRDADGVKVRGESFVHGVEETSGVAEDAGFEVLEVVERGVCEGDLEHGVVGIRGRKWIGVLVWVGFVVRKKGE